MKQKRQSKYIYPIYISHKDYVLQHITDGDRQKADKLLKNPNQGVEIEDLLTISYLLGVVTTILLVLAFAAYLSFNAGNKGQIKEFFVSFPIYRFSFCLILVFWYGVIARYVFWNKSLNYFFVLDIRPRNLGEFHHIVKVQTIITLVYLSLFIYDVMMLSSNLDGNFQSSSPGLFTYILFFTYLFFPLRSWLRDMKYGLFKVLAECFAAPFVRVSFIHILIADIMTSTNKVILDIVNSTCWVYQAQWYYLSENVGCSFQTFWVIVILSWPYYLRFMQCLRRYYDSRLVFPNLYNAAKYMFSIGTIILGNLNIQSNSTLLVCFLIVGFISFLFNNYWDNFNDWGLFKGDSEHRFLRKKIKYSPRFYYIVMILNFFLRMSWILTLLSTETISQIFKDQNVYLMITMSLEITRRFLWALIRVEFEIVSNFEKLRSYLEVPPVFQTKGKKKRVQPI